MKASFYIIILFILLLTLQISFFDVLFSGFLVPPIILSAVVVWTVSKGFRQALWWFLPLLLLYELLTSGEIRLVSLYGVLLAYSASFLSRRTLIENSFASALFYAFLIECGAVVYYVGTAFLLKTYFVLAAWQSLVFQLGVIFVIFLLVRKGLLVFQNYLNTMYSDRALMMR